MPWVGGSPYGGEVPCENPPDTCGYCVISDVNSAENRDDGDAGGGSHCGPPQCTMRGERVRVLVTTWWGSGVSPDLRGWGYQPLSACGGVPPCCRRRATEKLQEPDENEGGKRVRGWGYLPFLKPQERTGENIHQDIFENLRLSVGVPTPWC